MTKLIFRRSGRPGILGLALACLVAGIAVGGPAAAGASVATDDDGAPAIAVPVPNGQQSHRPVQTSRLAEDNPDRNGGPEKFAGPVRDSAGGTHSVFVEFAGPGAADTASQGMARTGQPGDAAASAVDRRAVVQQDTASVLATAKRVDGAAKELFEVANAVPGVAIRATKDALDAVAGSATVVRISTLVPKTFSNAGAAQLTRAVDAWRDLGFSGDAVKIGVVDTGIDYTHADFGGRGTVDAFAAARSDPADTFTPTEKVAGGHDFVGDDYDAVPESPTYQPIAHPDGDPIDCAGHGTHVAGTAAGFGVSADGTTFRGDYAGLDGSDLFAMKVAPGAAPKASLYALKVFGCSGGTDFTIPALDWALDPNGDGDFTDHLDIVNLSLGVDFAPADDPENAVVDTLARHGILAVAAVGNGGDLTDAGGSTGNAIRSLAVASSADDYQLRDAVRINAPSEGNGLASGRTSVAYPWSTAPDVTGRAITLNDPDNADGCGPLAEADAAAVAGRVVWLEWDEDTTTRRCGSGGRAANVVAAGAIGVLLTSDRVVFDAVPIGGVPDIPLFQLSKTDTERLRPAAAAGTLNVTFSASLLAVVQDRVPGLTDTLSAFSARGTHGSTGVVKPDVTAPGDTIASAAMGTGARPVVFSGTSMASPHLAGIAALVRQAHPTWSPEQVKAAIMNTANNDVAVGGSHGHVYGPARVGAGRVDAAAAIRTTVLAYNNDGAGGVSASFGVVQAPVSSDRTTRKRTILLQNDGSQSARLALSYRGVIDQPGVSYSVSPTTLTIKPGATATATVTMSIRPRELRKSIDPTMAAQQLNQLTGETQARQYVSDASGYLVARRSAGSDLRVPVYGAAKPTSTTRARDGRGHRGPAIAVSGSGFRQGSGPTAYNSMISVLSLGYRSPKEPQCSATVTTGCTFNATTLAGDLQYVGAGATLSAQGHRADGWLWFGISTFGDWATVGNSTQPYVEIDTTRDGQPDYTVTVRTGFKADLLDAVLTDSHTGSVIDVNPVNFHDGATDTNVFDTRTVLIPVRPSAIGLQQDAESFSINYSVGTFSNCGTLPNGDIDHTPAISFDVLHPAVQVTDPLYFDTGNVRIPYRLDRPYGDDADAVSRRGSRVDALVLHLHGSSNRRAEIVGLSG